MNVYATPGRDIERRHTLRYLSIYFLCRLIHGEKSLKKVRSICGIYLLPVEVSYLTRDSLESGRILTLVPHEQDPNNALQIIIYEMFKRSNELRLLVFSADVSYYFLMQWDSAGIFSIFQHYEVTWLIQLPLSAQNAPNRSRPTAEQHIIFLNFHSFSQTQVHAM